MRHTAVIEIGCEELPSGDLALVMNRLGRNLEEELAGEKLDHGPVTVLATPRRVAILIDSVAPFQEDSLEVFRGPAQSAAYDEDGKPTRAAQGFARSKGVALEDLAVEETESGPYVFARKTSPGERADLVLGRAVPRALRRLGFARTMFWGPRERFPRPVRWILALLDDQVLEMEAFGLRAGRITYGHRALHPGPQEVSRASEYLEVLEDMGVVADPARRREMIRQGLEDAAGDLGGRPALSGALLEEVTGLVELPTVACGRFDESFCQLPSPVLETTMRVHQKCFAVIGQDRKPLPCFLFVRNGDRQGLEGIRRGYERVMGARLSDAQFFFAEDRKRSLAQCMDDLEGIVFMEGLGSMSDKASRLSRLSKILGEMLGLESGLMEDLERASHLCKADLVTHMVGEFPELEGVMGREYALMDGEKISIAQAIYEHYLPRGAGDAVPETMMGTVLALSDRLDTLAGAFGAGIRPSGSQDPYGLRRRALGLVEILSRANLDLPLDKLVNYAVAGYSFSQKEKTASELMEFIQARIRVLLVEEGFRYDVVDAVLAREARMIPQIRERIRAVSSFLSGDRAQILLSLHRRADNLAQKLQDPEGEISPELFETEEERDLYREMKSLSEKMERLGKERDYGQMMDDASSLGSPLDRLLDGVLIMAPQEEVRQNRLLLLARIRDLVSRVADWSYVVR